MSEKGKSDQANKLIELQNLFHEQLIDKMNQIEVLWRDYTNSINDDDSPIDPSVLYRKVHSLVGSSGTFGALAVSSLAREIELVFKNSLLDSSKNEKRVLTSLDINTVNNLIIQLNEVAVAWHPSKIPYVVPQKVNNTEDYHPDNSKLVYLLGKDELFVTELILNLQQAGYTVEHFSDITKLETASKNNPAIAFVIDIEFDEGEIFESDFLTKVNQNNTTSPSIIFVSNEDTIESRLAAARVGSHRYFCKPVNIRKLINSLNSLTLLNKKEQYKILIIDDDKKLLIYYQKVLENVGINVTTLSDPLQALKTLNSYKPDVIILDVYMPGFSGPELAQIIRQDDTWALTPIIFLSSESNIERQLDAMNLGGDDFLVKPIEAEYFISSVLNRAQRARITNNLRNDLEDTLRESQFQVVTMNQHDIVSSTNIYGDIIGVNGKFCEISGYTRTELIGQNYRVFKSGNHTDAFYKDLWHTIINGHVWQGTICNRTKQGNEYWVKSTIVPFLDLSGVPYKYVSAQTDLTPLRLSEDRLKRSQLFANIGTWDWDIKTGSLFWSERIWKLFGLKEIESNTTYKNFLDSVHPDDRQLVTQAVRNCIENRAEYKIEHRIIWPNGTVHWMHASGDVIRDKNGVALHMLGVIQDITLRKISELKLNETEERNRLLLESVGEGIYGLDLKGNFTFVNPVFSEVLGFTSEDVIGMPMHTLIQHSYSDGTDYPIEKSPIYSALTDGSIYKINNEVFWHKEGRCIPVEFTSTPVLKNGSLVGVVTVFQDISARLKVANALITAKEDAEYANQAKSQFISSMSHELRTPMNAIMGFGQLLSLETDNPLNESQQENIDEIMKAAKHLLELINEILDVAKIESGKIELDMEYVSVCMLIFDSLQLINPLSLEKKIDVSIKVNGEQCSINNILDKNLNVFADKIRLKQVILNLLSNAVKYNKVNGRLIISLDQVDSKIRVSIADTGYGLSKQNVHKLFEPFERIGAEKTHTEGTGIGLFITKNLIDRMNGVIGVESKEGEGSIFWFELESDTELNHNIGDPNLNNNSMSQLSNETNKKYKVLYIEDNPANLKLVTQLLSQLSNIEILSALEPLLGLELAENNNPDLILVDINLPIMDGYQVLQKLRASKVTCNTPVVAVSANAMEKDISAGDSAGFNDYITKPIDVIVFLQVVKGYLSYTEIDS